MEVFRQEAMAAFVSDTRRKQNTVSRLTDELDEYGWEKVSEDVVALRCVHVCVCHGLKQRDYSCFRMRCKPNT